MTLEDQLQEAYHRAAERAPVSPGGAYDRFLRRRARRGRVVAATTGLALVAVLGTAVVVAHQLPQDRGPATPATNAAQPTPRPHQWVYSKELRVEYGSRKPFTVEFWIRVDGKKFINSASKRRVARAPKVIKEQREFHSLRSARCPGPPERIRPAVGLGHWFPNPSAVPTDPDGLLAAVYQLVEDPDCSPILVGDTVQDRAFMLIDGMLQTVQPPDVHAALYQALAKIPGVTVVQGATDAAGRRGVAFARAAAIEGPGSSGWLRLEIILDRPTYRYLGARHVVTRDHFTPDTPSGSKGTRFHKGQVLVSRAQLALAVVDAPCQRPGETTVCAAYLETTGAGHAGHGRASGPHYRGVDRSASADGAGPTILNAGRGPRLPSQHGEASDKPATGWAGAGSVPRIRGP
jgi:hypothetical protein